MVAISPTPQIYSVQILYLASYSGVLLGVPSHLLGAIIFQLYKGSKIGLSQCVTALHLCTDALHYIYFCTLCVTSNVNEQNVNRIINRIATPARNVQEQNNFTYCNVLLIKSSLFNYKQTDGMDSNRKCGICVYMPGKIGSSQY